jgi:glutamate dehydrogenase
VDRVITRVPESENFLLELSSHAREQLEAAEVPLFIEFAGQFLNRYPLEELPGRHFGDVFGLIYHAFRMLKRFDRSAPKIQIFNSNIAEQGWSSPHTMLMVVQRDMPFLVDSIRMELNRRNIAIHTIKSTVIAVARDDQHELLSFEGPEAQKEAAIVLAIRQHTREADLFDIKAAIASVLHEVESVVADYQPMLGMLEAAVDNLNQATQEGVTGVDESQAFLRWLMDNHFTFLGYSEYAFSTDGERRELREQPEKRLGVFRLQGDAASDDLLDEPAPGIANFHLSPQLIRLSKSAKRARVNRKAYADYIVVKRFNSDGEVCGEGRFLGLYTSAAYARAPMQVPLLREKVAHVFKRSGLDPASHDGKALRQILNTFPRGELLLANSNELFDMATGVARINERYMVRLFMRPDSCGKFVSCLVYIPRDVFATRIRLQIQELIGAALHSHDCEFITTFSESILARVYIVFKINPGQALDYDIQALQTKIEEIIRSWDDHLQDAFYEAVGEEKAVLLLEEYRQAFPTAYKEKYSARAAVQDILTIETLTEPNALAMNFYQQVNAPTDQVRFKITQGHHPLELSDVIPVLEHLGLRVLVENSFEIRNRQNKSIWLHDFKLSHSLATNIDIHAIKQNFQDAFAAIWNQRAESDEFNRLVLSARLNWREVVLLRAYANYLHQTQFNFTQSYIANALLNQVGITRNLVALFKAKFDPRLNTASREKNDERIERLQQKILDGLEGVANLNEDRILRRYLLLIGATLRTNYFQLTDEQREKEYLSIKLSPRAIADLPEPRPLYEIFVYSPRVEGVHLRGGKVSRGGLRWSDRLQDYRTEVLGLVKAQQVKNAVIVPSGAKGGFVCKQIKPGSSRDEQQQEAIACYQIFIRGLLDLTDNLVEGQLVTPPQLVRFDEDDPYLVVAADKGTASFSDIANGIAAEYEFWLGDAFASGGSQGYDHKSMGITARGAWISVQRHFKEQGIDVQRENFTVIGIGDMSGDVFGNGLLRSDKACLVAAFNHQHIFIDPTPDAERSFRERERLFKLPRSSWMDYEKNLISAGGGIFSRDAKSIAVTPQMQACFAIAAEQLTPNELIHALLKAPVDLLWNGGIGTYVKASTESHSDVGDKTNDAVRVDGNELRCKVIGEGGNLGMTQRGRVEYALQGGACNTDFIDNAGGVDCSDHEVNIKILLNETVANGDLTRKQRNQLLADMTDDVAQLVLHNNYRQTQAITIAQAEALHRSAEYRRFINILQNQGRLDRKLEFLPDDDVLIERQAHEKSLTRPELAILVSYAKSALKEDLVSDDFADDPFVAGFIEGAFPQRICTEFSEPLYQHRLRREIIATQVANDLVNNMGISFAQRLMDSTGTSASEVAKAYIIARQVFQLDTYWQAVEQLDYKIPAALQIELMTHMMRRIRHASRWFLRNRHGKLQPAVEINNFTDTVQATLKHLPDLLREPVLQQWQTQMNSLREAGVPEHLAEQAATPGYLLSGLSIVEVALHQERDVALVAGLYVALICYLDLPWFAQQIADVKVENFWQAMARESYLDDLEQQVRHLVAGLLNEVSSVEEVDKAVADWSERQPHALQRWQAMINDMKSSGLNDFAVISVALRSLRGLKYAEAAGS